MYYIITIRFGDETNKEILQSHHSERKRACAQQKLYNSTFDCHLNTILHLPSQPQCHRHRLWVGKK